MSLLLRLLGGLAIIGLIASIVLGAHAYLVVRLASEPGFAPHVERWLTVAVWSGAALLVLQPISERTLAPRLARLVAWPASIWMGLFFLLFVAVAASDAFLLLLAAAWDGDPESVARGRAALVLTAVVPTALLGLRSGLAAPVHHRIEIALARWPRALDGYRIAQISDIHIGPILGRRFAAELTERVNALGADLIAVTGDLVDGRVALLRDEVAPFASLRARDGVFFVTGNHDHYSGARSWAAHVAELGWRVLRNEHVVVEREGARFQVVGVDDHRSRHMFGDEGEDLESAFEGLDAALPTVLLAHDPSTFKRASELAVDLQLSGHTHGGQIWPFEYLVRLVIPFVAGRYARGGSELYVSRGTGFWGPPMRLGAPAEMTEIVLRCAD